MGAHKSTEADRVKRTTKGRGSATGRFWVDDRKCLRCERMISFYSYPGEDRKEPTVCAPCAAEQWARQGNRPVN